MNEKDAKPGPEEKAAARQRKKKETLAEIQSALPALYNFFMNKDAFLEEAQAYLLQYKEMDALMPEDLWKRYEYFVCSKLGRERRQAVLDNTFGGEAHDSRKVFLGPTRISWMRNVFSQARSDEKRRQKESSANLYHRIQPLVKKYRPEHLYFKGNRWYGRSGMEEGAVLPFEKKLANNYERSFIFSLPASEISSALA